MKMLWLHVTFHNRFPFYCIEWIRILPISEIYCKILWTTRREWMQESDREEIYWERAMEWECRECWKSVTRKWTWLDSLRRIHVKKNREQAHSPRMKWIFMKYVIQYPEYFYRANIILWCIFVFTYWQFEQHFYCQRQQQHHHNPTLHQNCAFHRRYEANYSKLNIFSIAVCLLSNGWYFLHCGVCAS